MGLLTSKKGFSESMSKFYAAGLIESLRFLHKNDIVYRDIKPENILIGNVLQKKIQQKLSLNEELTTACNCDVGDNVTLVTS